MSSYSEAANNSIKLSSVTAGTSGVPVANLTGKYGTETQALASKLLAYLTADPYDATRLQVWQRSRRCCVLTCLRPPGAAFSATSCAPPRPRRCCFLCPVGGQGAQDCQSLLGLPVRARRLSQDRLSTQVICGRWGRRLVAQCQRHCALLHVSLSP